MENHMEKNIGFLIGNTTFLTINLSSIVDSLQFISIILSILGSGFSLFSIVKEMKWIKAAEKQTPKTGQEN